MAGGENLRDTVRGPLSTGGLFGERAGWDLPGFPDALVEHGQAAVRPTRRRASPGTAPTSRSNLPTDQDTSLGVTFTDADETRRTALSCSSTAG